MQQQRGRTVFCGVVGVFAVLGCILCAQAADSRSWPQAVVAWRGELASMNPDERAEHTARIWETMEQQWPVEWDWILQDADKDTFNRHLTGGESDLPSRLAAKVLTEVSFTPHTPGGGPDSDSVLGHWQRYIQACRHRRAERLRALSRHRRIVFAKHYNLGGSHYAYTEGQSDAQSERHFRPGSALCLLELDGGEVRVRTLLDDPHGVIRDPDVSYDGRSILFAWKKSDYEDDYHLYEMDVASGRVRQITEGLGFADYEGVYLPNGDLLFNSTRCVQTVDCWWTEVSNLYTCDAEGRYLRRLSFDQVHTNYPQVLDDGRVVYTRWDYNDRGQIFPQGLFQMNADGTGQTEFYGNNSWFPTTLLHARPIPGSGQLVAIATGHHSIQTGKLCRVDPSRGRQEADGITLLSPVRPAEAVRIDQYGQGGDLFQHPYPLDAETFLVGFYPGAARHPDDRYAHFHQQRFKLYLMDADGHRELLAADPQTSCLQPVPLAPRSVPHLRPSTVDYRQTTGTYYVQDVHAGPGLQGVARGTIKKIRVVALEYRPAGIGENRNHGLAGDALASTPISIDNGSWDVKVVLGDAPVYPDGSACFTVPARTPVYFQALDADNHAVQTMRSWSTLQPGETFSCVGCHEPKNSTPVPGGAKTLAMQAGPKKLEPFYGPPRGFSFAREIQPILDRHCIRCHDGRADRDGHGFSLLSDTVIDPRAKRRWSQAYLSLTQSGRSNDLVNWLSPQSVPSLLPPYHAGAARSGLITLLDEGHYGVSLNTEERDKLACWIDLLVPYCGSYDEAHAWTPEERDRYEHFVAKRQSMEAIERANIAALVADTDATAWEPMAGSPPPVAEMFQGRRALRMDCRFKDTKIDRASWDRPFEENLAGSRGIEFYIHCDDLSPVSHFTCYLRSGQGWYSVGFMPEASGGWQRIRIDKSAANVEGDPAGWHRVDRIRLSAWRGDDKDTAFHVTDLRAFGGDARIIVVRNDTAAASQSTEARSVRQYVEVMARLLGDLGLEYNVLSDTDLPHAPPSRRAVVVLPYAPDLPDETVRELAAFIKEGGKILACYVLPAEIANLVNIHVGRHVRQESAGQFASIRPHEDGLEGMPDVTGQASWNIHHAVGLHGKSRTVATWYTQEGRDTNLPAIVAGPNAVFLTHVLLPDDPENKKRLLLSMLGTLSPDLWPTAARGAIERAGVFGSFESAEQVIEAIGPDTPQAAQQALAEANRLRDTARRHLDEGRYPAVLDVTAQLREKLLDAYCLSQTSEPEEFRAFWCHSAYGVDGMTWDQAVEALAKAGFTAVIPNMLWGGVAFYESDVLPTSAVVAQRGDAIAQCVAACKKHGLECHVWKVNFNMGWPTDAAFKKEMREAERTQVDFNGDPLGDWLCPSHPANRQLEIDAMLDVVRKYDVDGLHFDYIRYPHREACFCQGCRRRFEQSIGQAVTTWPQDVRRDEDLAKKWDAFRQEQITTVVRQVAEQARRLRPGVKISAAVFRNWPVERFSIGQDWKLWCDKGYLDFVCPMDYTSSNALFESVIARQLDWAGEVPCYPGIGLSTWPDPTDVARVIEQITLTRRAQTGGFVIFNYGPAEAREVLPRLGMGITRKR